MVGVGVAAAAVVASVLVPPFGLLALAPVLVSAGGAAGLLRQQSQVAGRVQLALEQVLDRLQHQELRRALPGLAEVIGAVTRTIR